MAGETTSTTATNAPVSLPSGTFLVPFTLALATGQLELADVQELGYLPANCTVYGFFIKMTDMDTNVSPLLAHKLTLGSTDVVTSITYGQAGTDGFRACTPTTITSKTLLKLINTAAAATAAAGTAYVAALVQK
jgi:hypothetical protein